MFKILPNNYDKKCKAIHLDRNTRETLRAYLRCRVYSFTSFAEEIEKDRRNIVSTTMYSARKKKYLSRIQGEKSNIERVISGLEANGIPMFLQNDYPVKFF